MKIEEISKIKKEKGQNLEIVLEIDIHIGKDRNIAANQNKMDFEIKSFCTIFRFQIKTAIFCITFFSINYFRKYV